MNDIRKKIGFALIFSLLFLLSACNMFGEKSNIDVDLYHSISFDSMGGCLIDTVYDIPHLSFIDEPTEPQKDGYNFVMWSTSPEQVMFHEALIWPRFCIETTPVGATKTLYAVWEEIGFGLGIEIIDGEAWLVDIFLTSARTLRLPEYYQGYPLVGIAAMTFYWTHNQRTVILPDNMRYIGEQAFTINPHRIGIPPLTVILNDGLVSIGEFAFEYSQITSIELPSSLKIIGEGAFKSSNLEAITIPKSVGVIGEDAFSDIATLVNVTIEDGVKEIGANAFRNTAISEITIPASIRKVGEFAFANNPSLTNLVLTEGVGFIGGQAFSDTQLAHVLIPTSVYWDTYADRTREDPDYRGFMYSNPFARLFNLSIEFAPGWLKIPDNKFRGGRGINKLILNEGLLEIGNNAFGGDLYENIRITTLDIPSTVVHIGEGAFGYCEQLVEVNLNEGLVSIGAGAFIVTGLSKVILPSTIDLNGIIGAFSNLELLVIPEGITKIPDNAFIGAGFHAIDFPTTLTHIGANAFAHHGIVSEIEIPATVLHIGKRAFFDSSNLMRVTLNEGLQTIGDQAFYRTSLREIIVPATVHFIGENAIDPRTEVIIMGGASYNSFRYIISGHHVEIIGFYGDSQIVEIPAYIVGMPVARIRASAFVGANIVELTIAPTVTYIGQRAFENITTLKVLNLGGGPSMQIGTDAFRNTGLQEVIIPDHVVSIDNGAFRDIPTLTSVSLGRITNLGFGVFVGSDISEIYIPGSLRHIPSGSFSNLPSLVSVTLNEGVESIGGWAFENTQITNIVLPSTVRSIGHGAFTGISTLTSATLNDGLEVIGMDAFVGTSISQIVIPASVHTIDQGAFEGVSTLTNVILQEGLKDIWGRAFSATSITSIVIPSTVDHIMTSAFRDIPTLTSLTFSGYRNTDYYGEISIWTYAFSNTGITQVTFPFPVVFAETSFPPGTTFIWD